MKAHIDADASYVGAHKRPEAKEKMAAMQPVVERHVARRRNWRRSPILAREKLKASARAKVEHAFPALKNIFRYKNARYKGLCNNDAQLRTRLALGNPCMLGAKWCAQLARPGAESPTTARFQRHVRGNAAAELKSQRGRDKTPANLTAQYAFAVNGELFRASLAHT